jgi:branched-chain amino acid transport system ATP-binding protein
MIEHVMKAIMQVCDRIMVLHHGAKLAEGTPKEIATRKEVIEVYLGKRKHV